MAQILIVRLVILQGVRKKKKLSNVLHLLLCLRSLWEKVCFGRCASHHAVIRQLTSKPGPPYCTTMFLRSSRKDKLNSSSFHTESPHYLRSGSSPILRHCSHRTKQLQRKAAQVCQFLQHSLAVDPKEA